METTKNNNEFNISYFLTCSIFGFILWILTEQILKYNNKRNKNNKYNLPKGPSFLKWFINYLFNFYDLKLSNNKEDNNNNNNNINNNNNNLSQEELIEDTSENTVLKWFNQLNSDNYCVSFFGRPMIFTRDTIISKYILSSNNIDNYTKPPDSSGVLIRLAQNSILMSEGDQWRYHRSIINQPFSSKNVKLMIPTIITTINKLINHLNNNNNNNNKNNNNNNTITIDIHSYCTKLTFDIIGKLSIGYDFNSIESSDNHNDNDDDDISKQFDFILNEMIRPIRRFSSYLPLYNDIKLFKFLNKLESIIKGAINSRSLVSDNKNKNNNNNNNNNNNKTYKKNFLLDNLLDDNVKEKDIIGNINTFLLAGHETSANLLTFIFYLLSTHNNIQNDLYNHLIDYQKKKIKIINNKDNNKFTEEEDDDEEEEDDEDYQSIEFLDWVIYETLRLFPPAPMIGRTSKNDDILKNDNNNNNNNNNNNISIPSETLILISVYAIHRDPKLWKDPNIFNPYRWKNIENINNRSDFIPFSSGGRVCVGQKFSIVEARIIISKLILNFELSFNSLKSKPFKIYQRATLTPKYPVFLNFKKRETK
ncbi:hypothetical protein ACTFIZ_004308 [Dictyostelium cf. discoideum]